MPSLTFLISGKLVAFSSAIIEADKKKHKYRVTFTKEYL